MKPTYVFPALLTLSLSVCTTASLAQDTTPEAPVAGVVYTYDGKTNQFSDIRMSYGAGGGPWHGKTPHQSARELCFQVSLAGETNKHSFTLPLAAMVNMDLKWSPSTRYRKSNHWKYLESLRIVMRDGSTIQLRPDRITTKKPNGENELDTAIAGFSFQRGEVTGVSVQHGYTQSFKHALTCFYVKPDRQEDAKESEVWFPEVVKMEFSPKPQSANNTMESDKE